MEITIVTRSPWLLMSAKGSPGQRPRIPAGLHQMERVTGHDEKSWLVLQGQEWGYRESEWREWSRKEDEFYVEIRESG